MQEKKNFRLFPATHQIAATHLFLRGFFYSYRTAKDLSKRQVYFLPNGL